MVEAATIPVEQIDGTVIVVAGEDDHVWPSADFGRRIATRRAQHGLPTQLVIGSDAGHRVVLPGEPAPSGGMTMARGGTPEADAELGRRAWQYITAALQLHDSRR